MGRSVLTISSIGFAITILILIHVVEVKGASLVIDKDNDLDPHKIGCRVCAPGYGVIKVCNGSVDTECGRCPKGTFNNEFTVKNPCKPCGTCQDRYYERTPCTASNNVVCLSCSNKGGGFGNEDFMRQCEKTTTVSTSRPTTPLSTTTSTREAPVVPFTTIVQHSTATSSPTTKSTPLPPSPPPSPEEGGSGGAGVEDLFPTEDPDDELTEGFIVVKSTPKGAQEETTEGVFIGELKDTEKVQTGGFQWPILVAAIGAAIVFFVIGVFVQQCLVKRQTKKFDLSRHSVVLETDYKDEADSTVTPLRKERENPFNKMKDDEELGQPAYEGKTY